MSLIKPILVSLSLISGINAFAQTPQQLTDTSFSQKDTAYWVYNFRQFRDAVYQGDKVKTRAFAALPAVGESNSIWQLVYDYERAEKLMSNGTPFTEADFYKYFNRLFPKDFIKCLLKVKTEELYKTGEYTTMTFEDSTASNSYMMIATWNKPDNTLMLNLNSRTIFKEGEDEEVGEFSIIYIFEITRKGHVKFKAVALAG